MKVILNFSEERKRVRGILDNFSDDISSVEKIGGGGHDGGMNEMLSRIAKLESASEYGLKRMDSIDRRLDRIDVDIRWLLGAGIAAAIGLAALMAKGFHWF